MNILYTSPSINPVLQLPVKPQYRLCFRGADMKNFLNTIKNKLENETVPEFGNFPPITSMAELNDKSRITFTLQALEGSTEGKKATFAFANYTTGKIAAKIKKFSSKSEFESYIASIKEGDLEDMLLEFKQKTK